MQVISNAQILAREAEVFLAGTNAFDLMKEVGRGMARIIGRIYPSADDYLVLVGRGNNGGDGLVVACELGVQGRPVRVLLAAPEARLGDFSRQLLVRLRAESPQVTVQEWNGDLNGPGQNGVVIDGLLGVQARGPLRGEVALLVAQVNAQRQARFFRTVALDYPTGLAAFEGSPAPSNPDATLIADVTIAAGVPKIVLGREDLADWVGRIEVVPWGPPFDLPDAVSPQLLIGSELTGLLPRRRSSSHKNSFGRLVVVAGGRGFGGAAILCAQGGQAIGAGLLSIVTRPEAEAAIAQAAPPEVMVSAWTGVEDKILAQARAIVIGPGLGVDEATRSMLAAAFQVGCPVVVDADGLTVLATHLDLIATARGPLIFTPHPGEMARLLGHKLAIEDREKVARAFVDKHPVTLVLKGSRTLVAQARAPLWINSTGNPSLSTGGSGDTLGGIVGGLLAQGLSALDAARLGVWLHGHAADLLLAERRCEEGATPTQLSATLGRALVSLRDCAPLPT